MSGKILQGSVGQITRALRWIFANDDPKLADDEDVLMDTIGSRAHGLIFVTQGRLMLTSQRLIYMPIYLRMIPRWRFPWRRVDIQLTEVDSVLSGSWQRRLWSAFPGLPIFSVESATGKKYVFQTFHAKSWQHEIERLIGAKP